MTGEILQSQLKVAPWTDAALRRLPGVQPLREDEWLLVDDAYAAQMKLREALIEGQRGKVLALSEEARPAADELLSDVLTAAGGLSGYRRQGMDILRPDGKSVRIDQGDPLATIGRICQADFCILQKPPGEDEHVLTGAILCFPASWTLAEKFMRPLSAIHAPVKPYTAQMGQRVQRMFDAVRAGRGLWRANALIYDDPSLFQPRAQGEARRDPGAEAPFIRSERQCITRLGRSGAVIFSIHTTVVARSSLSAEQARALKEHPIVHAGS